MQYAGRWTAAGQQMDHTACRQMDKGREIVQAVGGEIDNWARQLMHQAAGWQMDRKSRTGDGTDSRQTRDGTDSQQTDRSR